MTTDEELLRQFGQALRQLRTARGLTQETLAHEAGLNPVTSASPNAREDLSLSVRNRGGRGLTLRHSKSGSPAPDAIALRYGFAGAGEGLPLIFVGQLTPSNSTLRRKCGEAGLDEPIVTRDRRYRAPHVRLVQ